MPKTIEIDVTDDELDTIAATLYAMEPPITQKKGLRDTIAKLEHPIRAMLQKNFTHDEVADVLMSQFKVEELTGATLKRYLSEIARARIARDEQKVQKQIKRDMAKAKRSLKQSASEVPGQSPAESTKPAKQPKQTGQKQVEQKQAVQPKQTIAAQPRSFSDESKHSEPQSELTSQPVASGDSVIPKKHGVVGTVPLQDGTESSNSDNSGDEWALFNKY